MNRRNLLKVLGISAVGIATVPLWMDAWVADDLPQDKLKLEAEQERVLSIMVDTIIPSGEIPGAKDLEVDKFICTMVSECYEEDMQEQFINALKHMETVTQDDSNKKFTELLGKERLIVMETLANAKTEEGNINLVNFVKELTVLGYTTSQYFLENHTDYEFIPARFNGSFPVEESLYRNV